MRTGGCTLNPTPCLNTCSSSAAQPMVARGPQPRPHVKPNCADTVNLTFLFLEQSYAKVSVGACSVVVTYKPSMLVPWVRFPAGASYGAENHKDSHTKTQLLCPTKLLTATRCHEMGTVRAMWYPCKLPKLTRIHIAPLTALWGDLLPRPFWPTASTFCFEQQRVCGHTGVRTQGLPHAKRV